MGERQRPIGVGLALVASELLYVHAFNLDGYPNGWTVNDMADYLQRDRSAVSRDLTDCQQKGFIYRDKKDGNQAAYCHHRTLNK